MPTAEDFEASCADALGKLKEARATLEMLDDLAPLVGGKEFAGRAAELVSAAVTIVARRDAARSSDATRAAREYMEAVGTKGVKGKLGHPTVKLVNTVRRLLEEMKFDPFKERRHRERLLALARDTASCLALDAGRYFLVVRRLPRDFPRNHHVHAAADALHAEVENMETGRVTPDVALRVTKCMLKAFGCEDLDAIFGGLKKARVREKKRKGGDPKTF